MFQLASIQSAVKEWARGNPVQATIFALVGVAFVGGVALSNSETRRPTRIAVTPPSSVPPRTEQKPERHEDLVYADGTRYQWDGRAYQNSAYLTPALVPAETKVHRRIPGNRLGGRGKLLQEGMRVEVTDFVKCFRYDVGEYRCFRTFGEQTGVIVIRDLKREYRASLDESCSTLKRAMSNRSCWYRIEFDLVSVGSDHMETTRMYLGENVELTPA